MNLLQKKGIILYILPISYRNINPNKQIELFIKYSVIKNMSQMINDVNFSIKLKDYLSIFGKRNSEKNFESPCKTLSIDKVYLVEKEDKCLF